MIYRSIFTIISLLVLLLNMYKVLGNRFLKCIPMFTLSVFNVLYILAFFQKMSFVVYIFSFMAIASELLYLSYKDKLARYNLVTTEIITIFLVIIMIIIIYYKKYVWYSDEFGYWAPMLKTIWLYDGIPDVKYLWRYSNYPIGMPIIEWLGLFLRGKYVEKYAYMARLLFDFSFMFPMIADLSYGLKKRWAPLLAMVIFLIPNIFAYTSYTTLSVDLDLAIVFAYFIYRIFIEEEYNIQFFVEAGLATSAILLIKSLSIIFVFYAWVFLLVKVVFIDKKWNILFGIKCICTALASSILFILWKRYVTLMPKEKSASSLLYGSINQIVSGRWAWTGLEKKFISSWLKSIILYPLNSFTGTGLMGRVTPMMCIIAIIFLIIKYIHKKNNKIILLLEYLFLVSSYSVVFILSMFFIFTDELTTYTNNEYYTSLAISRYCSPIFAGISICAIMLISRRIINHNNKRIYILGILAGCILFANYDNFISYSGWGSDGYKYGDYIQNFSEVVGKTENNNDKVLCITDEYIRIENQYLLLPLIIKGPEYDITEKDEFIRYLSENYFDYIYYEGGYNPYSEVIGKVYGDKFVRGLYKIIYNRNGMELQKL